MKAHLITCETPIADGQLRTADCGKTLPTAWIVCCWDSAELGTQMPISTILLCAKCVECALVVTGERKRYVYGLSDKRPEMVLED